MPKMWEQRGVDVNKRELELKVFELERRLEAIKRYYLRDDVND